MKFFLTAALLVAATVTQAAPTVGDCQTHRDTIVVPMANARDDGMTPGVALQILETLGFTPQGASIVVMNIWAYHSDKTPEEIADLFMQHCAGEST